MGFVTATDSVRRSSLASVGSSHSSNRICDNALGAIRPDTGAFDRRDDQLLKKEEARRQLSALAGLVRTVEPKGADRLAGRMIEEFGSLGQIFATGISRLSEFTGCDVVAATIIASRVAVLEGLREEVCRTPVDLFDPKFLLYITAQLQGEEEEHLHSIFLDSHQRYIRDERVASGDWHHINIRLRPLLRRALELRCAKIILFHNHPSGDARPSREDVCFTKQAQTIASALDIDVLDHFVVAGRTVFSMRKAGYLP